MQNNQPQKIEWDHLHFWSLNPEASARWFAKHFGASFTREGDRYDVTIGGVLMFIAPPQTREGLKAAPSHPYNGFDHIGLRVKNIDAFAQQLKADGVRFTKELTTIRAGVRVCFIEGPEGISIELLQRDLM